MGLTVQPIKCAAWSPSGLPSSLSLPSGFTLPSAGLRVLGALIGLDSFQASFVRDALEVDVSTIHQLPLLGDPKVFTVLPFPSRWSEATHSAKGHVQLYPMNSRRICVQAIVQIFVSRYDCIWILVTSFWLHLSILSDNQRDHAAPDHLAIGSLNVRDVENQG
ncbi:hypothetical protein R1flu_001403 [Riccia fluitans]|uniref:Uncharacterized protein n=1 Tax=Riccia fluitans TaxID=41844 RepID=A0ABD1Y3F3_9MARC